MGYLRLLQEQATSTSYWGQAWKFSTRTLVGSSAGSGGSMTIRRACLGTKNFFEGAGRLSKKKLTTFSCSNYFCCLIISNTLRSYMGFTTQISLQPCSIPVHLWVAAAKISVYRCPQIGSWRCTKGTAPLQAKRKG
jgi:hypothetical protein